MSLPRLTRQLTLEKPQRSDDGSGGYTIVWTTAGSHFAEVKTGTGRIATGEVAALSRGTFRVIIRAAAVGSDARPEPGDRFREGTVSYRVDLVTPFDRGGLYLTCFVVAEQVQ